MLLIIHGELDRVKLENTNEFLKSLNVHDEITNMIKRIEEGRYTLNELKSLIREQDTQE